MSEEDKSGRIPLGEETLSEEEQFGPDRTPISPASSNLNEDEDKKALMEPGEKVEGEGEKPTEGELAKPETDFRARAAFFQTAYQDSLKAMKSILSPIEYDQQIERMRAQRKTAQSDVLPESSTNSELAGASPEMDESSIYDEFGRIKLNELRKMMIETSRELSLQNRRDESVRQEWASVNNIIADYVSKVRFSKEELDQVVSEAGSYALDLTSPGGPKQLGKIILRELDLIALTKSHAGQSGQIQTAEEKARLVTMAGQPAGAGIAPKFGEETPNQAVLSAIKRASEGGITKLLGT